MLMRPTAGAAGPDPEMPETTTRHPTEAPPFPAASVFARADHGSAAFAGRVLFRSELANLAAKHHGVNARAVEDLDRLLYAQVEPSSKGSPGADVLAPMHKALAEYAASRH